jgi:hypothetical protein
VSSWLDKRGLASHLACSVRSIEHAVNDGMPHAIIFGRVKFQVADVEPWLEQRGHLQRRGEPVDTIDNDQLARRRKHAAEP